MARKPSGNPRKNPNPKLSKAAQERRRNINNARRRYDRQAARYDKLAQSLPEGADRDIYAQAAAEMRNRSNELKGIDARKRFTPEQNALVKDSKNYLQSSNSTEYQRGETLGKLRLSGTNLGHRFYALTADLWEGVGYSGKVGDDRRLNAIRRAVKKQMTREQIRKYGKNPNANDLIALIEEIAGVRLESYTSDYEKEKYTAHFIRGKNRVLELLG